MELRYIFTLLILLVFITTGHAQILHPYDTDRDWTIGDFELLQGIDDWAKDSLDDFDLLGLIDCWAGGCYEWSSTRTSWTICALVDDDLDSDGYSIRYGDCDDNDPDVNPGMPEIPNNGKDDDCKSATPDDPSATDIDGDGLSNDMETTEWTIRVDENGFPGFPDLHTIRKVTSDPAKWDTDGDGLSDFIEYYIETDPRNADTDGDGLNDYIEWRQWQTNPNSIDSDGDSRGPLGVLVPNACLFDAYEINEVHDPKDSTLDCPYMTSPTLADTDGDNATDFEEYDDPFRHPLIAEVPEVNVSFEGPIDVRLNVEYAEAVGETFEYGETQEQSTTETESSSDTLRVQLEIGAEQKIKTGNPVTSLGGEISFSQKLSVGYEHTWSTSYAVTTGRSFSEYTTDSTTYTTSAATGRISVGLRISNPSLYTYELSSIGVSVLQVIPPDNKNDLPVFKTVGTLEPDIVTLHERTGVVIPPGGSVSFLRVADEDANVDLVKRFLSRPSSLQLEVSSIELLAEGGINYDFLIEKTHTRTASVSFDFGDGTIKTYHMATNVGRTDSGDFTGVTVREILSRLKDTGEIDSYTTMFGQWCRDNGSPADCSVLESIKRAGKTYGFQEHEPCDSTRCYFKTIWISILPAGASIPVDDSIDNVVLHAGEVLFLSFVKDEDGDGRIAAVERLFRSSDTPGSLDTDGDGLSDDIEINGWNVRITGEDDYTAYSDPSSSDSDNDGLDDMEEKQAGTDPEKADTDRDGFDDREDTYPLDATRLYVKACTTTEGPGCRSQVSGISWNEAFGNLTHALAKTATTPVSQIWVASGEYAGPFDLVGGTKVYGGFLGNEKKLGERPKEPAIIGGSVLTQGGENWIVLAAYETTPVLLDGFEITGCTTGCYAPIMINNSSKVTLHNLFVHHNTGWYSGGAFVYDTTSPSEVFLGDSFFINNNSDEGSRDIAAERRYYNLGGAIQAISDVNNSRIYVYGSEFSFNHADCAGGAISLDGVTAEVSGTLFYINSTSGMTIDGSGAPTPFNYTACNEKSGNYNNWPGGGAIRVFSDTELLVENSLFQENEAGWGGAIFASGAYVSINQSEFQNNLTISSSDDRWLYGSNGMDMLLINDVLTDPNNIRQDILCRINNSTFYNIQGAGSGYQRSVVIQYARTVVNNSIFLGGMFQHLNNLSLDCSHICSACQCGEANTSCIGGTWNSYSIFDIVHWKGYGNTCSSVGAYDNVDMTTPIGPPIDDYLEDAPAGNLRLADDSPLIDSGNNYIDYNPDPGYQSLPMTDLNGDWRIVDGNGDGRAVVDIGAYEYQGTSGIGP